MNGEEAYFLSRAFTKNYSPSASDTYTKTEVNTLLSTKADADAVTTKTSTAQAHILTPTGEGKGFIKSIYGMSVQDGTPTPSEPVLIEDSLGNFKCVGKNLIPYPYDSVTNETYQGVTITVDNDGVVTLNNTSILSFSSRRFCNNLDCTHLQGKTCILSGCPSGGGTTTYRIGMSIVSAETSTITAFETGEGLSITFPNDAQTMTIYLSVGSGVVFNNTKFYPMLRLANTDDTWTPYTAQTITTSITLRAIEVTSSDAYNLEYDGKYYIADSIDWVDGTGYVLTQRCYVADTLTATGVADRTASTEIALTVPTAFDNTLRAYNISTHFVFALSGQASGTFLSFTNDTTIIHAFVSLGEVTTVAEAQTWLDDNNVEFLLALKTPTTSTLTTAQTAALLGLVTYEEATNITPTAEPYPVSVVEYGESRVASLALSNHNEIEILKL